MPYVILRLPDRKFVAPPSSDTAHVSDLRAALFFADVAEAMSACSEGEIAVPLNRLVTFK